MVTVFDASPGSTADVFFRRLSDTLRESADATHAPSDDELTDRP
jgi:hypothetical protein